ncbi:phospholipid-binding protein, PBP family [Desulfocurvibacter africanus PCS]|uniref:Phospholipid-binding protein, PBP family n=1 Tax=Desulfocurvibacter africanus PCS TaxID=1262666 RepID=M5PQ56_DESAF|nr:YbhB/YbcL family Raf kinase inhibitor-like protein [Desulfocurvibacter africanus]EMG36452.1 phospholipid-binding protein, PBP family [Desulfocurvibacter africanus PCS]
MRIASPAFENGQPIPEKHSCDGEDVSPALTWDDVPQSAKSLTLVVEDPDAPRGTWDHWIVFNIPPVVKGLREGAGAGNLPGQALHGRNSWTRNNWGGPCPPSGTHRYFFKLFALDAMLDLSQGASKAELLEAMDGHILDKAELMGTYKR